jgi:hypothetical protein
MQRTEHIYVATYVTQKICVTQTQTNHRITCRQAYGTEVGQSAHRNNRSYRNQTGIHIAEAYSAQNRYHAEIVSVQT